MFHLHYGSFFFLSHSKTVKCLLVLRPLYTFLGSTFSYLNWPSIHLADLMFDCGSQTWFVLLLCACMASHDWRRTRITLHCSFAQMNKPRTQWCSLESSPRNQMKRPTKTNPSQPICLNHGGSRNDRSNLARTKFELVFQFHILGATTSFFS